MLDDATKRRLSGTVYFLLNLFGLCANTLVLVTLYIRWSHFRKFSFYVLVAVLASCDWIYLLDNLLVQVPELLAGGGFYTSEVTRRALASLNTIGFHGLTFCSLLIAIDRMSVFVLPRINELLFDFPRVYYTASTAYMSALVTIFFTTLTGCHKDFHTTSFFFFYACEKVNGTHTTTAGSLFSSVYPYYGKSIPIAILLIYIVVYTYLKWQKMSSAVSHIANPERERAERSLMMQGVIIGIVLFLEVQGFWVVQQYGDHIGFLGRMLVQCIAIMNSSINPIVYMAFNPLMRKQMLLVGTCWHAKTNIVGVQGVNNTNLRGTGTAGVGGTQGTVSRNARTAF